MKYQLIEYEGTTEMRRFRTEFGSSILTSYNIKRDVSIRITVRKGNYLKHSP